MLRAVLNIENNEDRLKESARIVKLLFYIADRIASLRLSKEARVKTDKNRKEVEKLKAKEKSEEQEEKILQKKREEERKWQEKLRSLPPEEQRKMEEKKREKDMQKQRKKLSKIAKF
jgi:hypothetical protein